MEQTAIKTNRVFGTSSWYVDSYINRLAVDELFKDGLDSGKHIIVYGSSKQGKSSLIRQHIMDDKKIVVDCNPKSELVDIYKSVLRQLNIELEERITSNDSREATGNVGAKVKLKIPFFGEGNVNAKVGRNDRKETSKTFKIIESNLSIAQDVSEAIKDCDFKGHIVIENFHYLPLKVQQELAFDLRTFEDNNILFIILGIWKERNRLTQYNGDLIDRLIEVPVEPWIDDDFKSVIKEGEPILNVSFTQIMDLIISTANGSIGVLQELCKYSCFEADVKETNFNDTIYLDKNHLAGAIERKVGDYSSRHMRCLEEFISGDETKLNLPYYFLNAVLDIDLTNYPKGINKTKLEELINSYQDENNPIRKTDFNRFFNHIVEYQIKKRISPPLFDFDKGNQTIKIIDSTFLFFIKHRNRDKLMSYFSKPD